MYKQFLEAVLPSQGNYCIFTLRGGKEPKQKFFENGALEDTYKYIEKLKEQPVDIYFALSSFEGFSRKAQESLYLKSLFLDIDVGKASNSYDTKTEAWEALIKFVEDTGLPGPVVVDSGNGLHVYWILKEAITVDEWKPYATSLLKLCQQHKLIIDPAVPADAARVLRVPNTNNYGKNFQEGDTPKKVEVVGGEVVIHDLDEIANCLGEIEVPKEKSLDIEGVRAGLTEEEIKLRDKYNEEYYEKLNKNYSHSFKEIAEKSLEGVGCAQIKFIYRRSR
jgi:hypothetical protein